MKKSLLALAAFSLFLAGVLPASAQSVDLLWQGETYTPPFYEGRALWSKESPATLVAVPQGLGDPTRLNYRWSKNGTVLGSLSGIGQSSLKIQDNVLSQPINVGVEIIDANKNSLASTYATLAPTSPQTVVYEKHPLYGYLFNLSVYEGYPMGDEATFAAFPVFFETSRRIGSSLAYAWKTNSQAYSTEPNVTFRAQEDGGAGTALVKSSITQASKLFGTSEKSFLVNFENDSAI